MIDFVKKNDFVIKLCSQFHAFIVLKKRRKTYKNEYKIRWEKIESPSSNMLTKK